MPAICPWRSCKQPSSRATIQFASTTDKHNGASTPSVKSMTPTQPSAASPNLHYGADKKPPIPHRPFSDPNHLAPEDAFYANSPPRRQLPVDRYGTLDSISNVTDGPSIRPAGSTRRRRGKDRGRSGSRRGKGVWKKLLWVKQKDCKWSYSWGFFMIQV